MSSSGIPVVVMGLGEIGQAIARAALARPELEVVGAWDASAALSGRSLGEVISANAPSVRVAKDPSEALYAARGGVVLYAADRFFLDALPVLERAVRAGVTVVSTCEELAYPWLRHEAEADALDGLCEERNVAVLGTGANPGFVLDRLPVFLGQVTGEVHHVRALRVVDLKSPGSSCARRVGVGLTEEAFHEAAERGEVGHVGLAESAALVATGLGLELDEVEEELVPLLAEEEAKGGFPVERGRVAGLQQVARVFSDGREAVVLELRVALGAEDPRDEVELDAEPPLSLRVQGGVPGEAATVAAVLNAVTAVTELRGLVTVLDLPAGR